MLARQRVGRGLSLEERRHSNARGLPPSEKIFTKRAKTSLAVYYEEVILLFNLASYFKI